jgi:hypothetical protein
MVGTRPRDAHRTRDPGMIDTTAADQVHPGVTASFRTYIGTLPCGGGCPRRRGSLVTVMRVSCPSPAAHRDAAARTVQPVSGVD